MGKKSQNYLKGINFIILPDWAIFALIKLSIIKITPFDPEAINPNSLDVRLGEGFAIVKNSGMKNYLSQHSIVDPQDPESFITQQIAAPVLPLGPNEFVLSKLQETISLPSFICAEICGRSSLGRLGLDNSSVSGFVDAGFKGELVIELKNYSKEYIMLRPGMGIGQIVFHLTFPALKPYGKKKKSKYQNQGGEITGSKGV